MSRRETLEYYTSVAPSPRERDAFQIAVRLARELGMVFRPGEVEVRWWHRESYEPFGFVVRMGPKPFPVWLGTGGDVEQIISTTAHELQHARDRLDGRDAETLDNNEHYESEARAKAFAAQVLDRWRAQQRPRPPFPRPGASALANERNPRMHTMSPSLEVAEFPRLAAAARRRVDLVRLDRRRRLASSRRVFCHEVLSDSAITRLTAAVAFLDELLAGDEAMEIQTLLDCRNTLAARVESAGADMPGW